MNLSETLAHYRKEYKKDRGMNWKEIADESGVKKFTIIKIIRTNSARFSTVQRLASYFGFSLDDIDYIEI